MTPNEDGFIPVAQCLEALVKPNKEYYLETLDRRRKRHAQVAAASHPSHSVELDSGRVAITEVMRRALDACEDLDTLLAALLFIQKTTNNYADQPETR